MDSFQTRAKELGAEVILADADGDDDRQFSQVKDMIKAGVKVLVLLPHDTAKASRMVEAAKSAGVKVISYDRLVQNSDVDLYVSFKPCRDWQDASGISGKTCAQRQLRIDCGFSK